MFTKGSILDIPHLMIAAFFVAITFLVVNTIMMELKESDSAIGDSTQFDEFTDNSVGILDDLLVFAYFGAFIAAVILAAMTRSTPIMFGLGILFLIIVVFISPIISNVYEDVADSSGIESTGHTSQDSFFDNLPTYILMFGAAVMIALRLGGGSE